MIRRVFNRVRDMLTGQMRLCIEAEVERIWPPGAGSVMEVTEEVTSLLPAAADPVLDRLALHSPGLKGFNWKGYIDASAIRVAHTLKLLSDADVPPGGRVLDYGAYFGNFSLALARAGYAVGACDGYGAYGEAFAPTTDLLSKAGIEILDTTERGYELDGIEPHGFDAVISMGVIEHIPHTPKGYLENLNRQLAPGGVLVLDTPNIAYEPNRQRLAQGHSIHPDISVQFDTELPFEGHHREYTQAELRWMLERVGHEVLTVSQFDYSVFLQGELAGEPLRDYRRRVANPDRREVLISASRLKRHA